MWGPLLWRIMHQLAYNMPDNINQTEYDQYILFYYQIEKIIPCQFCKDEYIKLLTKYPLKDKINNKFHLILWTIHIHNLVNEKLKKKIYKPDELNELYLYTDFKKLMKEFLLVFSNIVIDFDSTSKYSEYIECLSLLSIIHPIQDIRNFLGAFLNLSKQYYNKTLTPKKNFQICFKNFKNSIENTDLL